MVVRFVIVGTIIAAMLLWLGPLSVPTWAVTGFVLVVVFPMAIVVGRKRMHVENRLARALWLALTRK